MMKSFHSPIDFFMSPHWIVYLGFLTTTISVPKDSFFIHRFAYINVTAALVFFFVTRKIVINKQFISILFSFLVFSLMSAYQENADYYFVIRAFAGVLALQIAVFSYFEYYNYDYKKILRHYIIIALLLSYVAVFQEVSCLVGFRSGYDFSWFLMAMSVPEEFVLMGGNFIRVNSLFTESGYFAAALSPAVFLAIHNLLTGSRNYINRIEAVIVIIAIICTFSTVGYVAVIFSLIFNVIKKITIYTVMKFVLFVALLLFVMSYNIDFKSRVEGILGAFVRYDLTGYENVSSLIVRVNYIIAKDNFLKRPVLGSGFDSYKLVSQKTSETLSWDSGLLTFLGWMDPENMNYEDGSTMYFKVITEFGLLGVCAILWFLYANRVPAQRTDLKILQYMCLVFFLTYSFRTGQYIRFELWYFIGFYYCLNKYYRAGLTKLESDIKT
jgi:hypothetical protein